MLSGYLGKIQIANANFNEQANQLHCKQSEIFGKTYHNVATGLERVQIIYKVPDLQNISVDNDLLSIKFDINLLDQQLQFDELDKFIKDSQACSNRCKTNEYTENIIIPVYQNQPQQTIIPNQNQTINVPPNGQIPTQYGQFNNSPYGQTNNYGQMTNPQYGNPYQGQQMPVPNNYYQQSQQGYRNSWGVQQQY